MSAGIRHILDASRFTVSREAENSSKLPAFPDASPALYIVGDSHSADALAEIVADLKAQCPSGRVVVLADHLEPTTMMRALQAGVNGLCSTSMDRDALIRALELVMLGETFTASALVLTMLNDASHAPGSRPNRMSALKPANDIAMPARNFSDREVEILKQLMKGESNKVIAKKLGIAEATIKIHLKSILRKIGAKNRTQAALWATTHLSTAPDSRHMIPSGTGKV